MKNRNNTDKHKDNGILLLKSDLVKYYQEVMSVGSDQTKKLFNPEYVKKQIPMEYDGTNVKQFAKKYGYSEKTVRRMIKDL